MARWLLSVVMLAKCALAAAATLSLYTEEWPPVTYLRDGKAAGMAVEVVQALQKRLGDTTRVEVLPWARAYSYLLTRPNVMLFTVGRTPEREKLMTLVGPVAMSNIDLLARSGEAARFQRMGSGMLDVPVTAYRSSIFRTTAANKGFATIVESVDSEQSARMLMAGRVDLWVEGSFVAGPALEKSGFSARSIEKVVTLESLALYMAFSRGTPREVVLAWEEGLRALKRDGTFQQIYHRWLPQDVPPPEVVRLGVDP